MRVNSNTMYVLLGLIRLLYSLTAVLPFVSLDRHHLPLKQQSLLQSACLEKNFRFRNRKIRRITP